MPAPKLWNDLPLFIRNISSVNDFKKALKTYFFNFFRRRFLANLFIVSFYKEGLRFIRILDFLIGMFCK